ncbi:cytokine receptor-like [Drosophila takahashii]|uniref:cytokine receptor-like n=1 Tax=Drosophila takahashii TaxID=29030 RepID=UPI001CF8A879|nr:cytokine receptor-like [Drosophila takahashii]
MSWRTFLLITAVAFRCSSVQLSGIIYTLTNGLQADFTYDVCCSYNGSAPKPWEIQLKLDDLRLKTVPIDESTIGYRFKPDQLWYGALEFKCNWPGNGLTKAVISMYSLLETFDCFYTDIKTEMECSFHHFFEGLTATRLSLAMDNKYKAYDISMDDNVVCFKLPYPANLHGLNRNFTIEIDSQKQVYILNDIRMRKPYWPSNEPLIEQSRLGICVNFGSNAFKNSDSYEWKVSLLTPDPRFRLQEATLVSYSDAGFEDPKDVCFKIPPYINDTIEAYLDVRFNHSLSPWTNDNKYLNYTMKQLVPNMPEFLENGFYYDPNKKMIHVFWLKLKDLKFSGGNLTYIVVTDTGKKPLHQGNSSAVFRDWDSLQPATVIIWSQNSVGRSKKNHTLSVPILRDYKRRQPRNLQYHLEDHTLTWDPPQEEEDLSGYYIYSCHAHTNSNNFCEKTQEVPIIERHESLNLWVSRGFQAGGGIAKGGG